MEVNVNGTTPYAQDLLVDPYPSHIQARLEIRQRAARNRSTGGGPQLEFVIQDLARWIPGQTVRVAFRGGNPDLHRKIAEAASEWLNHGNLKLNFGLNQRTGRYRTWSRSDRTYKAEIRIQFEGGNEGGYWSIVGRDSVDRWIVRAGEPSMNYEGFTDRLPADWRATVLHEFGHAFGFQHEHQHPAGGCDLDFRWEDDPGYVLTRDSFGQFIPDNQGRRPGIYTVLGGPPNDWPRAVVDHNLRQLPVSRAFLLGPFDASSIMKYYFGTWMFRDGQNSHCFSLRNTTLSAEDKRGFGEAYPRGRTAVRRAKEHQQEMLDVVEREFALEPETRERFDEQRAGLRLAPAAPSPPDRAGAGRSRGRRG
jgi:hypothetical protein